MKTVRSISILFLLITITLVSKATTTEEYSPNFQAEENEIYSAFSEIDPVISYMEENSDATANEVSSLFPMASINYNDNFEYFPEEEADRFYFNKQAAFFMGCLLNLWGVLIVAIVNNGDSATVNKSIWGCVASGCVTTGVVVVFYAAFFSSFYWY
jgi:hypothetical protein